MPFPTFVIPGNMDVGNKRTAGAGAMGDRDHRDIGVNAKRLDLFSSYFGPIHWTFLHRGVRFTGIYAAVAGSGLPHEDRLWRLLERLPQLPRARHHVAVMHYWPFIETPDEPLWDMGKEDQYLNWYFSIDPPHRQRLLSLLRGAGVEILFCGHVHTGRPVQVVDGLRLYRTAAAGNTAQLEERWPDAETRQGLPPLRRQRRRHRSHLRPGGGPVRGVWRLRTHGAPPGRSARLLGRPPAAAPAARPAVERLPRRQSVLAAPAEGSVDRQCPRLGAPSGQALTMGIHPLCRPLGQLRPLPSLRSGVRASRRCR